MSRSKPKVAIIGTGKIGTDLAERILKEKEMDVVAFVGRRKNSENLLRFKGRIPNLLAGGIDDLLELNIDFDGVFDATSALSHVKHWKILNERNKWVIDLTPSNIGIPMVPSLVGLNSDISLSSVKSANYSMITCGGQSAALVLQAFKNSAIDIEEIEVSSSISALSAGPATRLNIDHYCTTTEKLMSIISGCGRSKAILVINPMDPPVMMRTTLYVMAKGIDIEKTKHELFNLLSRVQKSVPGYEIIIQPKLVNENIATCTVKVIGAGYYLPSYAGNLDIINAAAVETAMMHYQKWMD